MRLKDFLKKNDNARYNKRLAQLHQIVFGTKEGRELLQDYMTRFHIMDTPEAKTDREHYMNDGMRIVVQHMLAYSSCNPNDFLGNLQDNFED